MPLIRQLRNAVEAKKKEVPPLSKVRQHKKTVARLDAELKENTRNLSMMKMKSMVFMTASMVAVFGILSSMYVCHRTCCRPPRPYAVNARMCACLAIYLLELVWRCVLPCHRSPGWCVRAGCRYEGRVVAKLPFHPISFITGITHRSLLGDDMTDCSFVRVASRRRCMRVTWHLTCVLWCPVPNVLAAVPAHRVLAGPALKPPEAAGCGAAQDRRVTEHVRPSSGADAVAWLAEKGTCYGS